MSREIVATPGRIPKITFSDDTDYDGLCTILSEVTYPIYAFNVTQVGQVIGRIHELPGNDTIVVMRVDDDANEWGDPLPIPIDLITEIIYL